jgi:hypothetical protein
MVLHSLMLKTGVTLKSKPYSVGRVETLAHQSSRRPRHVEQLK